MKLSKRMETIASYVGKTENLADVGCDHGYLSIELIRRNVANHVYAMDINKGPLEHAKEHIIEAGLSGQIDVILCDGLKGLTPGMVDTVVIAGMGGPLMIDILSESKNVADMVKEFVLQPQSEINDFRHYLCDNGYRIEHEDIVFEDGKYYPIFHVTHGASDYDTELDYEYGKHMNPDSVKTNIDYIKSRIRIQKNIIDTLEKSEMTDRVHERLLDARKELSLAHDALRRWDCEM